MRLYARRALYFFSSYVVMVEIRDAFTVIIRIILQIAFEARRVLLIANCRVWRCNVAFTVIIAAAKMHRQGRRSKLVLRVPVSVEVVHLHRRGHPRSPRGTVTLVYTHSRSGHPAGRFPRLVRPVSPAARPYHLFSRQPLASIASHRIFLCTSCASRFASRASRPYRAVARRRMHKSQCCASATECSAASCNNVSVLTSLMHTRGVYTRAVTLLRYYYIFCGFPVF